MELVMIRIVKGRKKWRVNWVNWYEVWGNVFGEIVIWFICNFVLISFSFNVVLSVYFCYKVSWNSWLSNWRVKYVCVFN